MKKLFYLFATVFVTSIMLSCAGNASDASDTTLDSAEVVDTTNVDSSDTATVNSVCLD